jgi:galactokinase
LLYFFSEKSKMTSTLNKVKVSSPGRINIIGEHTDYNGGFVLPAAINKEVSAEIRLNGHASHCTFHALDLDEKAEFDWAIDASAQTSWQNYLIGVIEELRKRGADLRGVDIIFSGNVPIGSGMSSSAALECSIAYGLNELFNLGFDKIALTKIAQKAEHNYVGTMCGIMDQFASMMGKADRVMLLDCRSLEYKYLPLELGGYEFLILNTNVSHSLSDSGYNARRQECEAGVLVLQKYFPKVELLRDVTLEMLETVKGKISETVYQRCHYVISENNRVLAASEALEAGNLKKLGKLMYLSHAGLSKKYEVSCAELDFLVEQTQDKDYVLGARMMGGGFGGCTINLIEKSRSKEFVAESSVLYEEEFGFVPTAFYLSVEGGTKII